MESKVDLNSCSQSKFIKNVIEFEKELKTRLKWDNKQWNQAGDNGSKFNKLCNSLKYWKSKLKPAEENTSMVITLFNSELNVKVSLIEIVEAIESIDKSFVVKGYANFRNPRYLCLYFESLEVRNKVKDAFRLLNDSYVVYLSWALDSEVTITSINVHWLPLTLDLNIIEKALENYVKCIEQERKSLKFLSGRDMPSAKVVIKVELKKDTKIEEIPHVMDIFGMEALITISGRSPLCLNCNVLGHVSKECSKRYCGICRDLKDKIHVCAKSSEKRTYADIAKNQIKGADGIAPDDWGDSIYIEKLSPSKENSTFLENKIKNLEERINANKIDVNIVTQTRLEKKRKAVDGEVGSLSSDFSGESSDDQLENMEEQLSETYVQEDENACQNPSLENYNENVTVATLKEEKKKNKKKNTKTASKTLENQRLSTADVQSTGSVSQIRSYGRPKLYNARRMKEQEKFDKLEDKREFVFED